MRLRSTFVGDCIDSRIECGAPIFRSMLVRGMGHLRMAGDSACRHNVFDTIVVVLSVGGVVFDLSEFPMLVVCRPVLSR